MCRCLLICSLFVLGLFATGCARGEEEAGASRLRAPSMSGDGLDGGVEPGEPKSYLQHLP